MMLVRVATPEDVLLAKEQTREIDRKINTLTPREERVLRLRFCDEPFLYREIGNLFGVSKTRPQQIEWKALRKLRHPSRGLQDYCAQIKTSHAQAYRNLYEPHWKRADIEAAARADAEREATLRAEQEEAQRERMKIADEIERLRGLAAHEAMLAAKRARDAARHAIEIEASEYERRRKRERERGFDLPPEAVAEYARALTAMLSRYRGMRL